MDIEKCSVKFSIICTLQGSLTTAHKPQNSSYVAFCNFLCNFVIFGSDETQKLQNGILLRPRLDLGECDGGLGRGSSFTYY